MKPSTLEISKETRLAVRMVGGMSEDVGGAAATAAEAKGMTNDALVKATAGGIGPTPTFRCVSCADEMVSSASTVSHGWCYLCGARFPRNSLSSSETLTNSLMSVSLFLSCRRARFSEKRGSASKSSNGGILRTIFKWLRREQCTRCRCCDPACRTKLQGVGWVFQILGGAFLPEGQAI